MSGCCNIKSGFQAARPVLSLSFCEARRRALGLYRAFYRYIPSIVKYHDIPKNEAQVRDKIRALFYQNAKVTDCRVIDILVIKGYMELNEVTYQWQQKGHIMANWGPSVEPRPATFICKFLNGNT